MSDRKFGVEIECYDPNGDYDYYDYNYASRRVDTENLLVSNNFDDFSVGSDDSLNNGNGVEIRSPILIGDAGIERVKALATLLYSNHYWVDESCGLHVHHNAPEFIGNDTLQKRFIRSWLNNQEHFANLVEMDRWDNEYSELWNWEDFEEYSQDRDYYGESKRGAFNLNSLDIHGTIEIRFHEGTLDANEIDHWIRLGQNFVDYVVFRSVPKINDHDAFFRRIRVNPQTRDYFSRRIVRRTKRTIGG